MLGVVAATSIVLTGCNTPWPYIGGAAGATVLGAQAPTNEIEQVYYLGVFDPREQLPPAVYRITVHGQASFISQARFASGWVPANLIDTLNEGIGYDYSGNFSVSAKPGDVQPSSTPSPVPTTKSDAPNDEGKPVKVEDQPEDEDQPSEDNGAKKTDDKNLTKDDGKTPPKTKTQAPVTPAPASPPTSIFSGRRLVMFGPEGFREAPRDHRLVIVMGSNPAKFFKAIGDSLQDIRKIQIESSQSDAARQIAEELIRIQTDQLRLTDVRARLEAAQGEVAK